MHYDPDSRVLYITNRGSSFMQYFYLDDSGGAPEAKAIDKFQRKESIQQTFFLPKRYVSCGNNEMARCLQFCGKTA